MSDIKNINLKEMLEVKKHIDSGDFKVKVLDIQENNDGSGTVNIEMSQE